MKGFKDFLLQTNALALAIGVIIGAAAGKVVTSLVSDVLMPPIGLLVGKVDFSSLFINLSGGDYASLDAAKKAGAATINYGIFINAILDFVIIAFVVYMISKVAIKPAAPGPATKTCGQCGETVLTVAKKCKYCTSPV